MVDHEEYWSRIRERGVAALAEELTAEETERLTEEYGAHNYHPLPVVIARAEGAWAYDTEGRAYLDCIGAYSAVSHGHLSPFLVETACAQLRVSALTSRAMYTPQLALFLEGLCRFTECEMACPMNTGAEAVETAIKIARKWAYTRKGVPDDRAEIVVAAGNFHGRTTTIVGFSSEDAYKRHFGPFTPGFVTVPFGDISALAAAITPSTAAVLMEPIQAEAGILIPPDGYLAAVRTLCDQNNILLIWDEIQTGFGRAGRKFAWQYEDARPDLLCLGKALGGGVMPVSAVAGTRDAMEVLHPGDHGSTFGGSPLACAVALAALAEMEVSNLAGRSAVLGARLLAGLRALEDPRIEDVRGRGLLAGLEFHAGTDTGALTQAFLHAGLLTKETRHRTFRFAPPLTIDESLTDEIVRRVALALAATVGG
ncbi:ornithine--oxo-acid transaminase [Capsulimonas corticalis]|uniref:ornithine aminotransferase n=2 Tax=Capsulimonas corticalis TaxID=2219043 RepID=A0A402CWV2_9BACT|nr:ornithine--oxo-acid transaminase [Capsulimonas corticalis]